MGTERNWTPEHWEVEEDKLRLVGQDYVIAVVPERSIRQPVDIQNLARAAWCVNLMTDTGYVAKLLDDLEKLFEERPVNVSPIPDVYYNVRILMRVIREMIPSKEDTPCQQS